MKQKSNPVHFLVALLVGILLAGGGLLAWLFWPDPPEKESVNWPRIKPLQYNRYVEPTIPEPVVSAQAPFVYQMEDITYLNAAETMKELRAKVRCLLEVYVGMNADVQKIAASLPAYKLETSLADGGENGDKEAGDGIWSGYLEAPELPVCTDIPLSLEVTGEQNPLPSTEVAIKVDCPLVYPIEFYREPAGPITPGTPVKFFLEFNQPTHLSSTDVIIPTTQQVVASYQEEPMICKTGHPRSKKYEIEWRWSGLPCPGPGVEHPLEITIGAGKNKRFQLACEPVLINYTPITFTSMSFDPPPPFKRGSTVKVFATTGQPAVDGEVFCCFNRMHPLTMYGNGRTWMCQIQSKWSPSSWGSCSLPCELSQRIQGVTLSTYAREVAIEPMPRPKIVHFSCTPDGPVKKNQVVVFEVELDPPVDFGIMKFELVPSLLDRVGFHFNHLCTINKMGKSDSDYTWKDHLEWPQGSAGNWGPIRVTYTIPGCTTDGVLYQTEFVSDDFVVYETDSQLDSSQNP